MPSDSDAEASRVLSNELREDIDSITSLISLIGSTAPTTFQELYLLVLGIKDITFHDSRLNGLITTACAYFWDVLKDHTISVTSVANDLTTYRTTLQTEFDALFA